MEKGTADHLIPASGNSLIHYFTVVSLCVNVLPFTFRLKTLSFGHGIERALIYVN